MVKIMMIFLNITDIKITINQPYKNRKGFKKNPFLPYKFESHDYLIMIIFLAMDTPSPFSE